MMGAGSYVPHFYILRKYTVNSFTMISCIASTDLVPRKKRQALNFCNNSMVLSAWTKEKNYPQAQLINPLT